MGYPVNPDGSFIYDHPQPTPQRLADQPAAYDTPCAEKDCAGTAAGRSRYCQMHLDAWRKQWAAIANDLGLGRDEYQDGVDALYTER